MRSVGTLVLVALTAMAGAAGTGAEGRAHAAEIRIALAAPLSGQRAPRGLAMARALADAVAKANAAGGVLGAQVLLDVEDDGCQRAMAEGAARAIVARGARLVIGHPCSHAAVAARAVYAEAGTLFIAVGARHPDVTRTPPAGPVLRLAGRDDRQGTAAAHWLLAHAPGRRIAIVQDRTAYARAIADQAAATLAAAGVETVLTLPIVAGRPDYAETVARISSLGAEAVLFAGYPDEAAVLIANLDSAGLTSAVLGVDALATGEFAAIAARSERTIEVLLPSDPAPQGADDEAAAAAQARGAFELWCRVVALAGATDGATLAARVRTEDGGIETEALGRLAFDPSGDLAADAFKPASALAGAWIVGGPGRGKN